MQNASADRETRRRAAPGFVRAGALLLAACVAACAPMRKTPTSNTPPPRPSATHAAPKAPPARSVPVEEPYAQDKEHARIALAKKSSDTLAQADLGYYMDVLQGRLRQAVAAHAQISRHDASIVVSLSGRCEFAPGRVQPDADARSILDAAATVLREYRKTLVTVQVFAAAADASASDVQLLRRCAVASANALAGAGLAAKRIVVPGVALANLPPLPNDALAQPARFELAIEPVADATGAATQ